MPVDGPFSEQEPVSPTILQAFDASNSAVVVATPVVEVTCVEAVVVPADVAALQSEVESLRRQLSEAKRLSQQHVASSTLPNSICRDR